MTEGEKRIIVETIQELFEKMFFISLNPVVDLEADTLETASVYYHAFIGYETDGKKTVLHFYLADVLAKQITGNFVGIDISAVEERQLLDTVGETANMAVGSLLGQINPEGTAVLGMPESSIDAGFSPEQLLDDDSFIAFRTSSGPMYMIFES